MFNIATPYPHLISYNICGTINHTLHAYSHTSCIFKVNNQPQLNWESKTQNLHCPRLG